MQQIIINIFTFVIFLLGISFIYWIFGVVERYVNQKIKAENVLAVKELKENGFSPKELLNAGYTIEEITAAGFDLQFK
ncbi:MAG: hypothetical protein ACQKHC_03505 [Candidatus Phytoplasma pruni]|uniref:hypothetical protein n=1 Tax=Milkweed yellows phytoplasma TaxID=208434 RepID=UPI00037FA0A7|nr:hypothetical protein [Milkweed yellows phytoplasma]